jgi:replication factor C small subunit
MEKNIYVENFRPKRLSEVVGQEHVTSFLQSFVSKKKIPHMIFSGPAGTGKTTCAIALARELYGDSWKNYFMEINASDDSGIETVRIDIKGYARTGITGQKFKIIFMDEADAITPFAQNALRRIIEMYSDKCRFILSCNFPNKLIEPIKDRCLVFRFKAIKPQDMKMVLEKIAKSEEIDITPSALYTLAVLSKGSMRKALNTLEKLKLGGIININDDTIYETVGFVNEESIKSLVTASQQGDIKKVDKYVEALLYDKAYDATEIIEVLWRVIKESETLPKELKIQALTKIGDIEFRIAEKANPEVQLKVYMVYLMQLYEKAGKK